MNKNIKRKKKIVIEKEYQAALYIRLSREDEKEEKKIDSESVKNQRILLTNYSKEKKYNIYKEYVDDGYSGSNFDRPSFKELLKDIEEKKVNLVIVKDLSRLGRNTIETSEYLERYFPKHNVRFIAILDDIDTSLDTYGNEMAPFKVFINSFYNKETSKKIKTTLRNKKQQGLFTGWKAPYGYKKDKKNKYHLVIDKKTSPVIKEIFTLALLGKSAHQIANILSNKKIPTPNEYAKLNKNKKTESTHLWCARTIEDILSNETYIGNLTQGRRKKIYGIKMEIHTKKEDWIIVKNTHKAIIEKEVFEKVQKKNKRTYQKISSSFLFKGLLVCKECRHSIGITKGKNRKQAYTSCNYYRKYSKFKKCTPHTNNYYKLEQFLIEEIQKIIKKKINYTNLKKKLKKDKVPLQVKIKKEENKVTEKEKELDAIYLDYKRNFIKENQYLRVKKKIELEIEDIKKKVKILSKNKNPSDEDDKVIEKYLSSKIFLSNLIDKIELAENKVIDIYFNFKV